MAISGRHQTTVLPIEKELDRTVRKRGLYFSFNFGKRIKLRIRIFIASDSCISYTY